MREMVQTRSDQAALETLIIGSSAAARHLRDMIRRVARSNASVMLCGPSGSGKELVARAIHDEGVRAGQAFSAINCGAIPADLIESELFGHEKGSFTGATARRIGHFRSEEHTSELQSLMRISYAVFCLNKKKQKTEQIAI